MRVLVACEFSGAVRDAFIKKGHDAWSCDILPGEGKYHDKHKQGDVLALLNQSWDMMIAHPPCTYLSNSGVMWLHRQEGRWDKMREALNFWEKLANADIPRICIENPIQHKYAKEVTGQQSQVIQPWMFGHKEQKATCLWLKNLPLLEPTDNVKEEMMKLPDNQRQRLHYLPPGPDRAKLRSTTFQGIADAMADQWGTL